MTNTPARAPLPTTASETSAERPWPLRLLTSKMTSYIAKAPAVWVEGQVVQLTRRPGQGTCFLTLRDTDVDMSFNVSIAARTLDSLAAPLGDGAHVVVHVRAELWPRRGSLSLSASEIRPVGVGELLARIEHLRRVLASEGLFAADRKKPLPFLPGVVGLICGRASAAEKDVVENARRRWPGVRFEIRAVAVQGPKAVNDVIDAVEILDADPQVDVIVITRGGGSLEDLLPFSNESLLRVVSDCRTPIVSAIGHEEDQPLLDLVADVRASTPTDAAKLVVPDVVEELGRVREARRRASLAMRTRFETQQRVVGEARLRARETVVRRVASAEDETSRLHERARTAVRGRLDRSQDDVGHLRERVRALSPFATLERGYAVVQRADGSVLRDPAQVTPAEVLRLRVAGGELTATALADDTVA